MSNRVIGSCLLALSVIFVGSPPVAAQDSGLSVSGSYDFLYREFGDNSHVGAHFDVAKSLGIVEVVGEVGINHFVVDDVGDTVTSFQGGVRHNLVYAQEQPFRPFVQFLLGGWFCCEENAFVIQPGFGIDLPIGSGLDVRAEYDFRRIFYADGYWGHRVSAGIVKRF